MLEKITFENHLGERIEFGTGGIFANQNELHDFSWDHIEKNNKIVSFRKSITEKNLPVLIICRDAEEGIRKKNLLTETMEKDVLAAQGGKIVINGYYMKCFVTASKKSDYLLIDGYMKTELTVLTDTPYWIKEATTSYIPGQTAPYEQNLDYPFEFAFDYHSGDPRQTFTMNNDFTYSDFEITIYGPCQNPALIINSVLYRVNADVNVGECLKINSLAKKIYKRSVNGEIVNLFHARERNSYIFTKISPGRNVVIPSGDFSFDITLIEKRSEPKWI